jgi:hypothetical protein
MLWADYSLPDKCNFISAQNKINILREQHSNNPPDTISQTIINEAKISLHKIWTNWQKNQFWKMNCLTFVCNRPMKILVLFGSIYFVAELFVRCALYTKISARKKERLWYRDVELEREREREKERKEVREEQERERERVCIRESAPSLSCCLVFML